MNRKLLGLLVALLLFCSNSIRGELRIPVYYFAQISLNYSGKGKVYCTTNESEKTFTEGNKNDISVASQTVSGYVSCYIGAQADPGYHFTKWKTILNYRSATFADENSAETTASVQVSHTSMSLQGYKYGVETEFVANSYTIVFDGNGGTSKKGMSNLSATYDQNITLTANNFTKKNATFKGWKLGDDIYADKATVKNLTTTNNGTVTLVAQWEEPHSHSFSTEWTKTADAHYHACIGQGECTITDYSTLKGNNAKSAAYAAHSYGSDNTKASYYTCSVCGYENQTRKAQYHVHSFSTEWTMTADAHYHACTSANCAISNYSQLTDASTAAYAAHSYGSDMTQTSYFTCSVCGYENQTRKAQCHTHSFATTEWTSTEAGHYHACTSANCTITDYSTLKGQNGKAAAFAAHSYGTDNTKISYCACSICGYESQARKAELVTSALPSVTLNSAGYATYSSAENAEITSEGVKAYFVTMNGSDLNMVELDGVIPAGMGVILQGTASTAVSLSTTFSQVASNSTGNILQATTTATESVVARPAGTCWVLGDANEFLTYEDGYSFIANRAYFIYNGSTPAKELRLIFDDTAIKAIPNYELQGTKNGKYIVNGKLVIVKNGKKYNAQGVMMK